VEILALYTTPETLETAVAAGARHLAATLDGLALVYAIGAPANEPGGWAGFTCAKDAESAGRHLQAFRKQVERSDRPLRTEAPDTPPRVWGRAAGGLYGFPLRHAGSIRGTAIVGCPGDWPRMRNAEVESILKQITLILDHHAVSENRTAQAEPSDELLLLSEQLLAQDIDRIKQNDRIEQAEQVQNELTERISYELKTPLNSIIERIISVLSGEHENLSDNSRNLLRAALDDGNTVLRLLQNISDLWRLRQNLTRVEVQDVNIADVVEEAIFNVRDRIKPEVVLDKRLSAPLPKVRTDLAKLNQILFHLLDNAAKFTRRGHIHLEISVQNNELLCSVADTGIGISPDDHPHIFDEFFQVDGSTGGPYRGAGLGLTLTQALIEQLNGSISFSSEIGEGSRFSFSLPVAVS
jgi:signal transduction histidine kinase